MNLFTDPNIAVIVAVVSLILAIVSLYVSYSNSDRKSVIFLHFENSMLIDSAVLKETNAVKSLDSRLGDLSLNKISVYISNYRRSVVELGDWSKAFQVSLEGDQTIIDTASFYSTNENTQVDQISIDTNTVSFKIGELEHNDILKADIQYFSQNPQKGKIQYKLRGQDSYKQDFLSNHKIVEDIAGRKFAERILFLFPLMVAAYFASIYFLLLGMFNLKTSDVVSYFRTEPFSNYFLILSIALFIIVISIPVVMKIYGLFVPFSHKTKKVTDFIELSIPDSSCNSTRE